MDMMGETYRGGDTKVPTPEGNHGWRAGTR